jgi:hypothetical protein
MTDIQPLQYALLLIFSSWSVLTVIGLVCNAWLWYVTPNEHNEMFKERRFSTILNCIVRLVIYSIYLFITLQIFNINPNDVQAKDDRRFYLQWFELLLYPITLLNCLSDIWLQDDRDIIQGYSKVDNLIIVSTYQRIKPSVLVNSAVGSIPVTRVTEGTVNDSLLDVEHSDSISSFDYDQIMSSKFSKRKNRKDSL